MDFLYNTEKAIQAVGVLLQLEHGKMNYMRLIKFLYMAERESLKETGYPIIGDRVYAMERGPILSYTLDLIKSTGDCGEEDSQRWNRYFRTENYNLIETDDPGSSELCDYEIQKLKEISSRYKNYDEWAMSRLTHRLKEYSKNEPQERSRKRIPLDDILEAIGRDKDAEAIKQHAKEQRYFKKLFNDN